MKQILTFTILLMTTISYAQTQFLGKWLTEEKNGIVEIYQDSQGQYQGKLIKLLNKAHPETVLDKHNPDASKRHNTLLGTITCSNFTYRNGELTKGQLYDPKTGKIYKGKIWIEDGKLMVRGYIGFLYNTQTWTAATKE